ncbi:MAG: choice-of-anchor E domain-containing protein [Prosthecobacter sp.]
MKKLLILTFALLTTAVASKAAVISETVDFGTFNSDSEYSFSQFNTALGTLNSVTLSWTFNSNIVGADITNQNTGTVTVTRIAFTNTIEGFLFNEPSDEFDVQAIRSRNHTPSGGQVVLTSGQNYHVGATSFTGFSEETEYVSGDANFESFKGTGDVPVYLTNTFGATPTASGAGGNMAWLTSITGNSTGSLEVIYNYTAIAPVPEPSALILGCGGLFFMTAFAFKKRKPGKTFAAA